MTAEGKIPPAAHKDAAAARQKNDFAVHGFANISAFHRALRKKSFGGHRPPLQKGKQ